MTLRRRFAVLLRAGLTSGSAATGLCCCLTINEGADPDVRRDMVGFFGRLVPQFPERFGAPAFAHAEENSDAHIKTSLFGPQLLLPVSDGRLCLGRWQAVYLCEADGPRRRTLWAQWLQGEADE